MGIVTETQAKGKLQMAMPKKGSRSIVVDAVAYRWGIRGRETRAHTQGETNLIIAVEPITEGKGVYCPLIVDTSTPRPVLEAGDVPVFVTPAVVEAYIRLALKSGWKPTETGKPFMLVADEGMATGKT